MKKKDVVAQIYREFGDLFLPYGFRLVKSAEAFIRKTSSGDQRLYLSVEDLMPSFVFTVVVGIRIDSVEKICHQFSGTPEQHQEMSVSSITQLEYFSNEKLAEYSVATPEQVAYALKSISEIILDSVIPFLERCTDAKSLDRFVNSDVKGFNVAQLPYGAMTAITLAFLSKNPRAMDIVAKYQDAMRRFPENERRKLDALVVYLSKLESLPKD